MISIRISESIKERCPEAVLGVLQCRVSVHENDAAFLSRFHDCISSLSEVELSQANKRPLIQSTRNAYKKLGKDPNRYRNSAEAMCRRIAKERGLYYINNVVDINNYLSIYSGYAMGTYDISKLQGDIVWQRAPEGTTYQGIGKDIINIEYLPALFDDLGAFGNPTSDNTRAMITNQTTEILLVYYCFDGGEKVETYLTLAKELLETHANGQQFEINIIK